MRANKMFELMLPGGMRIEYHHSLGRFNSKYYDTILVKYTLWGGYHGVGHKVKAIVWIPVEGDFGDVLNSVIEHSGMVYA